MTQPLPPRHLHIPQDLSALLSLTLFPYQIVTNIVPLQISASEDEAKPVENVIFAETTEKHGEGEVDEEGKKEL
jgi:hypothetical protein